MDKKLINRAPQKDKWKRIFMFTSVGVLIYFILISSIAPKKYYFIEGDIASSDIKAPRDIIDEEATKIKEQLIIEKIDEQYTLKNEVKIEATENIKSFFNKLINLKSNNIESSLKKLELKKMGDYEFTDSQYNKLLDFSTDKATELQWVTLSIVEKVYEKEIKENDENAIKEAKAIVDEELEALNLDIEINMILREITYKQIKPNFLYDKAKTDELKTEALKNVSKEMIKKNQLIVREGEPITEKQIGILSELGLIGSGVNKTYVLTCFILVLYVLFTQYIQYQYLNQQRKHILKNLKLLAMILSLNVFILIIARFTSIISPLIIPMCSVVILLAVLIDYKLSIVINVLNLMLISVIVGFNPQVMLVGLTSIVVSAVSLKKVSQSNDILYTTLYVIIAVAIVTLTSGLTLSNNVSLIIFDMIKAGIGALISGVLAIGLLPFLESSFNLLTNVKLLDLSNPNSPLLKRLLMEAPGTYHHSIMVANLAEVATEEVGGNPILSRVGAYYHDIGKIKRPTFFSENQLSGINPHDRISAIISTSIIISHVRDGLDLAEEYNLPTAIKDIIAQHHGRTLVKYFYYTAKNSAENSEEINEEDFRYEGPRPKTKEAAIIMLADSVEAAVRSINEPTMAKIEEMVNNIIKDKLYSNQLDNCDLTFKDLQKVKDSFMKVLIGLYHQRIEYPTEKVSVGSGKE